MVRRILFTNLVFIVFIVALLLLSLLSYERINQQAQAANLVDHTYLVKLKLQSAFATLLKAESAQRGYILTSDKNLLNQFNEARNELPRLATGIDSIVKDNPDQVKNLEEAKRLFKSRLLWLQNVIDTVPHVTTATLDSMFMAGTKITDSIAAQIALMSKTEDKLLSVRLTEKLKQEKTASTFVLLFSIFSLIVIFFAYLRLKGESNLLKASMIDNSLLESMVDKRTAELLSANEKLNAQNDLLERKNVELNSFTFIASPRFKRAASKN
jgi:CHASE3 domain sensor protein